MYCYEDAAVDALDREDHWLRQDEYHQDIEDLMVDGRLSFEQATAQMPYEEWANHRKETG